MSTGTVTLGSGSDPRPRGALVSPRFLAIPFKKKVLMRKETLVLALGSLVVPVFGATPSHLDTQLQQVVQPYVTKYCVGCHSGKTPAAQFDLKAYTTMTQVTRDYPRWALVMQRLTAKEMPPKPVPAPPAADTQRIIDWIQGVRAEEIRKYSGDPGLVSARRLSNAEYNYTI